jgi:hypothetical protein
MDRREGMPPKQIFEEKRKGWIAGMKGRLCRWRNCQAVHDGADEGWMFVRVYPGTPIAFCPKHADEIKALVDFEKGDRAPEGLDLL